MSSEKQHSRPEPKREVLHDRILSSPFSEEYLEWKERTIRLARTRIKD